MVNVLVVDDSRFIRKTIRTFLEEDSHIHVVGEAGDGKEAISQAEQLQPDVITMDLNMPNMDGVTAIRNILKTRSVPILVFTSASKRDGPKVLEALNAGAVDFISKEDGQSQTDRAKTIHKLRTRVLALVDHQEQAVTTGKTAQQKKISAIEAGPVPVTRQSAYDVIAIGASTGGPVVIENILKGLGSDFPVPILIIQHMPAEFTRAFADRLDSLCQLSVTEAEDGMLIKAGTVYLAPGGKQMEIEPRASGKLIRITEHDAAVTYKPCVDITYQSVAAAYGKKVLAIVLTGMGADGKQGAELLKQKGATVWAQDQNSSVVFGMPMAIIKNNLADRILSDADIGTRLARVH